MSDPQVRSIREWAEKPTPDSARLLIRTYHESEWRSTRLEVIRALGKFSDNRSLPFLIDIIKRNADLAEQELAVLALSRQKTRGAKLFLKSFYAQAPDALRASVAYALGQAQVFQMADTLMQSFDLAMSKQDYIWLKNIILSLGELKAFQALPKLRHLVESGIAREQDLRLPILFALGRLEREPQLLVGFEGQFLDDSLLWQVYQSTLTQIQIRSQFKLEDYLSKIFESEKPHAILPLELRAFDEAEVQLGLSLFPKEQHWKRHLLCLKALSKTQQEEFILGLALPVEEWGMMFESLASSGDFEPSKLLMEKLEAAHPILKTDLDLRLHFLNAFLPVVNWAEEAKRLLVASDGTFGVRFLNQWSEWAVSEPEKNTLSQVKSFLEGALTDSVYARLLRACVELGVEEKSMTDACPSRFQSQALRSTLLLYAETFNVKGIGAKLLTLPQSELRGLGPRVLTYVEAMIQSKKSDLVHADIEKLLAQFEGDLNVESQAGVLRVLRHCPLPACESLAISGLSNQHYSVELNAVIALKSYPSSRSASEALVEKLASPSLVIQGRALDSLCRHTTLVAKRGVMEYLREHIDQDEVVDKIFRDFDPEKKGGPEFAQQVNELLKKNSDHPQWEKLVALRDRLLGPTVSESIATDTNSELVELDQRLESAIPKFKNLDPTTKLALRAAEQPFLQSGLAENLPIDKAPTVLEYCKALDLILEKHLGQKHLFPKLDRELHDFQTLWHRVGFGEDYPQADRVMSLLGLKGKITPEHFPLHKAKMMCGTFFNGKIVQDRFKIFDGLRAWAVIFLIFARKIPLQTGTVGPILKLSNVTDEKCVSIAKKLMSLQDLRNPAAHRQTYTDLSSVKAVRNEAVELTNTILELVL